MPKRFPPEFKADVVRVARRGDLSIAEVAADFDISVESVKRWKRQADIDEGIKDGLTTRRAGRGGPAPPGESPARDGERDPAPSRGLLRQGRRSQNDVPAGPRFGRRGVPGAVDLRGARLLHPGLLQVAVRPDLSNGTWDDAHLTNAIVDVHGDDPEFGYRFIADELERAGHEVGEGRVQRLCREHRIWSTTTKKGRRSSGKTPGPAVHDDLVNRDFTAPAPDMVWLTDITEHPTARRQALRLLHQGRLLEPDRRLLDSPNG